MRQITTDSINAFMNATPFNKQNMEIKIEALEAGKPCLIRMYLFGNMIAERHTNKRTNKLRITNAGWQSNTTKERLNGLNGVSINQSKGVWYLNGKEWNGELIDIKQ